MTELLITVPLAVLALWLMATYRAPAVDGETHRKETDQSVPSP